MNNATNNKKFIVGQTYATRSACNWDCVYSFTIVRRTEKSVWIDDIHGKKNVRRSIKNYSGHETFSPFGTYSMSPTISADRKLSDVVKPDPEPTPEPETVEEVEISEPQCTADTVTRNENVATIEIDWTEAGDSFCGKFDSWSAVNVALIRIASEHKREYGNGGGYYKTGFTITMKDGGTYGGRIDIHSLGDEQETSTGRLRRLPQYNEKQRQAV